MKTIVLVDDSPDIRRLVRSRLKLSRQFDVVGEGANGLDAIELATQHQPDLVLLDVSMAGMDGLEAIPLVITASPRTRVVMFSGFDEQGLAERAISVGASGFIEKSIPLSELADRLLVTCGETGVTEPDQSAAEAGESTGVIDEHLERFRAAFDDAAIGMATLTLTGRIVRANAALDRLVGRGPGALVGTLFADLVDEDTRPTVHGVVSRVASGELDAENANHGLKTATRLAWVVSTAAVVRDSSGVPLYLFLQVQDISERRATERQLQQSEEMFRLLVEGVADYAIFMLDPRGHIASWNLGAQRIKGWTADEVLGTHFRRFYTDADRERQHPEHELEMAVRDGRYEEEGWRVRKDGSQFWANVVITAIRDSSGTLVGFAKVTRDVTDRLLLTEERDRAAAQLAKAARERTEFLAVTAHELRGPVALLSGFAELLRDHWRELDDGERDEMATTLARTSTRLRRLVEDLLTAARLESGALEVRLEEVEVAPIIRAVVNDLTTTSGAEDIEIDCPDDLRVVADPGRLHQMLGNYVSNSIRYAEPPITITASGREATVEIAVLDRGEGVEESVRGRLFDKFVHGTHEESTGLGLFIVRELAVAQGGDARFEERPDGGSRFVLDLPAPRASP
ncbi:MAG TPA: PAS domain S-box protein [Acidimicrobiales bacterium]|nr:PAS domain S-box protein [Acidimicrobiales bacterium]